MVGRGRPGEDKRGAETEAREEGTASDPSTQRKRKGAGEEETDRGCPKSPSLQF